MYKTTLALISLLISAFALNSCGTIQGMGNDVKKLGGKIENTATQHKTY